MLPKQIININSPIFAGIDVGSLTAKCVFLGKNGIHACAVMDTGTKPNKAGETVFGQALDKASAEKTNSNMLLVRVLKTKLESLRRFSSTQPSRINCICRIRS